MDQPLFRQDYRSSINEEPLLRIILARLLKKPKPVLIFLGLFASVAAFFYWIAQKHPPPAALPVIQAPPGPFRVLPTTDPTLLVPHQDRQVYQNLEKTPPSSQAPKVEHLLPPVEAPFLSLTEEEPPVEATEKEAPPPLLQAPATRKEQPPKEKKASIASIDQLLNQKLLTSSSPESSLAKGEKYRLQLGSLPTREAAEKEWERIQKMMKEKEPIFKHLKPRFERVDLGTDKGGVVYRIIVGNIGSQEGAKRLEKHLKERKVHCRVISP